MTYDETFRTVAGRGRAAFEIRGSKFIGYAAPAATVAEAEAFLEEVGAEHADATHTVSAYRVRSGEGMIRARSSDDGEPSGSAGKPALNVLEGREVVNAAVVIARYFGGTELGVGGLVRAYTRGTKDALDAAGIVERRPRESFAVAVEYDDSGTVRGVLESAGVEFEGEYGERVRFEVRAPTAEASDLRDRIRSATSGRAELETE